MCIDVYNSVIFYSYMDNISFIKSEQGKNKLILKGYIYIFEQQGLNKLIWKCENYLKIKCKGRLHNYMFVMRKLLKNLNTIMCHTM